MEILFYDFNPDQIYYMEYEGKYRQCKAIKTFFDGKNTFLTLEVAGVGTIDKKIDRQLNFDEWYYSSKMTLPIAESLADLKAKKLIHCRFGATDNCYNSKVIKPLFPNMNVCECGGGITFYQFVGNEVRKYSFNGDDAPWEFDENGFRCPILDIARKNIKMFKTEKECHDYYVKEDECVNF